MRTAIRITPLDFQLADRFSLEEALSQGANLTYANLTYADLTDADLTYANLRNADLTDANLRNADLRNADLTGADLTGADLTDADLAHADLTYANLRNADLTGANLTGVNLTGAKTLRIMVGNVGSRGGTAYEQYTDAGLKIHCGCFYNFVDAFEERVKTYKPEGSEDRFTYLHGLEGARKRHEFWQARQGQ